MEFETRTFRIESRRRARPDLDIELYIQRGNYIDFVINIFEVDAEHYDLHITKMYANTDFHVDFQRQESVRVLYDDLNNINILNSTIETHINDRLDRGRMQDSFVTNVKTAIHQNGQEFQLLTIIKTQALGPNPQQFWRPEFRNDGFIQE